ncbi:MAG: ImmA/IrrE family metallo-endopeptidase [Planctomycetota bacterium]
MPVRSKYSVPFLHRKVIEEHAEMLLGEWALEHSAITEPPVPIEDILELGLKLDFEIEDLRGALGHDDVLGAIWFGDRLIKIDQSLDPTRNSRLLGRYRFTIAHEVGHWRLHRQHLMNDPSAAMLFEQDGTPAFVCRSTAKPSEEKQADMFASCVLMPRRLVFEAWEEWRGSRDEVALADLAINPDDEIALDAFCRPLADCFEVSAQAMRYRLEKLELIVKEVEPRLF